MLTINVTENDGRVEVALAGRLDAKAAKEAEAAFIEAAALAKDVVLDLADMEYVASAGLRAVKRLRGEVKENGKELTVRGVQEDVMEIFEMTGFAAMLAFE